MNFGFLEALKKVSNAWPKILLLPVSALFRTMSHSQKPFVLRRLQQPNVITHNMIMFVACNLKHWVFM